MTAIILAAGFGRRMGRLTDSIHKTLLKIGDKTIIERIMDNLINNGVSEIVVVTGYRSDELREFLRTHYPCSHITFIHNARFRETNNIYSLSLALNSIEINDDILLIESDLIFEGNVIQRIINSPYSNIAFLDHFKSGMDGTVVTVSGNVITSIIPPHLQGPDFDFSDKYKTLNIYRFSREFCNSTFKPLLAYYTKTMDGNCYYELILGILVYLQKETIYAEFVEGERWAEIDDPNDLYVASFIFDEKNKLEQLKTAQGGNWNHEIIDFCFIRNMYFPNNSVFSELKNSLINLCQNYGSSQDILDQKLAFYVGCQKECIHLLNGLSQIYPMLNSFWHNKTFLLPDPTFGEYPRFFKGKKFYADRVGIDIGEIERGAKGCDVVVFVNPNNPTGSLLPSEQILDFGLRHRNKNILVDESFIDFSKSPSLVYLLEKSPQENMFVVKSLSKSLGVPGLRLGFTYSHNQQFNRFIRDALPIWNINSIAEHFLEVILKHKDSIAQSFAKTVQDREAFSFALGKLPFVAKVHSSEGNFILIELKADSKLKDLCSILLLKYSIYVKDVSHKFNNGKRYVRIAVRLPQENQRFIESLKASFFS